MDLFPEYLFITETNKQLKPSTVQKIRRSNTDIFTLKRSKTISLSERVREPSPQLSLRSKLPQASTTRDVKSSKISVDFNPSLYPGSPLMPGLGFYKTLVSSLSSSSFKLKVNIPETFIVLSSSSHFLWTDPSTGFALVSQELRREDIFKEFKTKSVLEIPALIRIPKTSSSFESFPLSLPQLAEKILKGHPAENTMIQRYIKNHGERPSFIRLFYVVETKGKASSAFSISSSSSAIDKFTQSKIIVNTEESEHFELTKVNVRGELESVAKELVGFIHKIHWIRINSIVLDFIKDSDNKLWLIGCKGFELDKNVNTARNLKIESVKHKSKSQIIEIRKEEKYRSQTSIQCKLCLLPYKTKELTHVLPFSMLLLFKRHMLNDKRCVMNLSHIREVGTKFLSHSVRVCGICYLLLVKEYELIEIEKKIAHIFGIEKKPESLTKKPYFERPPYLPAILTQWRLLLYFKTLETRCKAYPFTLEVRILGSKFSTSIQPSQRASNLYKFFATRMFYIFTRSQADTRRFSLDEDLEVLVKKDKTVIGKGNCKPFSLFSCSLSDMTQPWRIKLDGNDNSELLMYSGICRDDEIQSENLTASLKKYKNVYLPDSSYFTAQVLPVSWIDMFGKKGIGLNSILEESDYEPTLRVKGNSEDRIKAQPSTIFTRNANFNRMLKQQNPLFSAHKKTQSLSENRMSLNFKSKQKKTKHDFSSRVQKFLVQRGRSDISPVNQPPVVVRTKSRDSILQAIYSQKPHSKHAKRSSIS